MLAMITLLTFTACGGNYSFAGNDKNNYENTSKIPNVSQEENEKNESPCGTYKDYNIAWVGSFNKDKIAPIAIHENDGSWWGGSGETNPFGKTSWNGTYYWGYMDIDGNIIVPPSYYLTQKSAVDGSAYRTVTRIKNGYSGYLYEYKIFDKKGNKIISSEDDGVVDIGAVSQGLYWVLTVKEELSGNIYTTTYYDAYTNTEKFKFENTVPGNTYYAPNGYDNGTFTAAGYAIISTDNKGYIINTSGTKIADLQLYNNGGQYYPFSWNDDGISFHATGNSGYSYGYTAYLDVVNEQLVWEKPNYETIDYKAFIQSIPAFSNTTVKEYNVSDDEKYISVVLSSPDNVTFCAVIDMKGNVLMNATKDISNIYRFVGGMAAAKDAKSGKWGYIGTDGHWIITPQYDNATSFSGSYATVNYTTVIDTTGKVVLDCN